MNASTKYTGLVRITVGQNAADKTFGVFSEDLPGLFLAGKDLSALMADLPTVIKKLYKLSCGMDVDVTPATAQLVAETASQKQFSVIPQQYVVAKQLAA